MRQAEKQGVTQLKVYLFLMLIIVIWGISWPISKMGLAFMPPIWYAACRLMVATVSMFLIVGLLGKFIWPKKQDLKIIFAIGLLQVGLFMILINVGLFYVSAGRTAVLVYTTPLWVVPISIFVFKEKSSLLKWVGFILGILGIVVLFNPFLVNWSDHNVLIGNGLLLLSALCWAIAILCARYMSWPHTPLELISWQLLVGTIPVLVTAVIEQPHPHIEWNHVLVMSILYTGIFATAIAYWGTVLVSKELPPITTSLSLSIIPVFALLLSAALLHEPITISIIIAMLLILSGVVCVIFEKHQT